MRTTIWTAAVLLLAGTAAAQEAADAGSFAIVDATVMTAGPAGTVERGIVLVRDGKFVAVGAEVSIPAGVRVIDGSGKFLLPGIIDTHSHMGVYPWPYTQATADGNEATSPITPEVRVDDSINLEDPAFDRARAGGVTTVLILPGSANLIGGQGAVLKLNRSGSIVGMRVADQPLNMKMACGENPKRVYGGRKQTPATRMGSAAYLRQAFTEAVDYGAKWKRHADKVAKAASGGGGNGDGAAKDAGAKAGADENAADKDEGPPEPPDTDLRKQALLDIVEGRARVHLHGYTVSDYTSFLRVFDEFGIKPRVFHHALEAYKMRDELLERGIAISTWADWWGFKVEAYDGIPQNAAICSQAGINVAIHSDSSSGVQRLWHEASKCVRWGMTEEAALRSITINPAWQIGVDHRTGSIEVGKDADLALFDKHPFDVRTNVLQTWVEGVSVFVKKPRKKRSAK